MKKIIKFSLVVFLGIATLMGCKEKDNPFVDENLINEWTLEWYEDINGNKIHEKPENLPQDIMLVFRLNNIVSGHIASFDVDGSYKINKDGYLAITLGYPRLPFCCQWDQTFLDTYPNISSYSYDGGNYLKIFYDNDTKVMLFSK